MAGPILMRRAAPSMPVAMIDILNPGAVHHRHEGHGHKNREDEGEQPAERDLHPATAESSSPQLV